MEKRNVLNVLQNERNSLYTGVIYHKSLIDLTYHSNRIEGNHLIHDQVRYILETNAISTETGVVNVDDIIETVNHFRCIDMIIDNAQANLTEKFIKNLHSILKTGTSDSCKEWFAVGGQETTLPQNVSYEIKQLLQDYHLKEVKTFEDIIEFHVMFERIHPFQDGNGRIGRLIMFKECLKYNIVPFIIEDSFKLFYYRGLKQWNQEKGYLRDTCLTAQDRYKSYLDYFQIQYQ